LKKLKIILQSNYTYLILFVISFAFILFSTIIVKYESKLSNETELIGIITSVEYKEDKITFILKTQEKVMCNFYFDEQNRNYKNLLGKKVKVYGNLKEPTKNTIPNTFNYKKYLYQNKIYKIFNINQIKIIEEENLLYKFKNIIINKLNDNEPIIKTYLNLFILGENTYLDDEMYSTYRDNGIWHLFAISGTHISLIILFLSKIFQKLKFKNIIIYTILIYFMFLTDFAASIMRATIFYFITEILKFLNIKVSNIKILLITAFLVIIFNPFAVYNVGFQYSFLISLALIKLSNKITGNYFEKIFKISYISFLVSLPITINMNYEINLLSILLNIIYVPFISFVVFPASVISFFIPFVNVVLIYLINILQYSNNFFSNFNINIVIPKMHFIFIIIYYLFLFFYFKLNKKTYLILIILTIIFVKIYPKLDSNYYVTYLDVGQGDSSILITPYKKEIVMVDTGGNMFSNYHMSNNTILFLKSIGITKLDYLVLTHGDYDHMGEAINLVENFKVEKVIFNCGEFNELERNLIKVLEKKKIPYYSCFKELNLDDNKLYFLNNKDYRNENDNSSVIYTELNNHKFLFMGDAGVEVEEDLIEKYNLKDIDVLKVGHHGSKTSSSKNFINEINPEYSIISAGKNNRYGHPNDSVLEDLDNSKVYRTDQDGSIMFKINNKLKIETCSP